MTRSFDGSIAHQERARKSLARGVATAFRASQLPVPICFERGEGSRIVDVDGNEYVDYALGFGPLLLGHSPPVVLDAVRRQLATGLGYGASHRLEAELSEAVCRTVPSAGLVAFSNTGSEAVHSAIRIARAATGRNRVVKFLGHYDGWYDSIHVGVPPQSQPGPGTSGQDPGAAAAVTVCPWNDVDALADALGPDVAAVIMEPLNVNGGCIAPAPGYLERVRELTRANGSRPRLRRGDHGLPPRTRRRAGALRRRPRPHRAREGARRRVRHLGGVRGRGGDGGRRRRADGARRHVQREPGQRRRGARLDRVARGAPGRGLPGPGGERPRAGGDPSRGVARRRTAAPGELSVGTMCAFVADRPVTAYAAGLAADAAAYRRFAQALLEQGMHVIPRGLLYLSTEHGAAELELARASVAAAAASYLAETAAA